MKPRKTHWTRLERVPRHARGSNMVGGLSCAHTGLSTLGTGFYECALCGAEVRVTTCVQYASEPAEADTLRSTVARLEGEVARGRAVVEAARVVDLAQWPDDVKMARETLRAALAAYDGQSPGDSGNAADY